MSRVFQSYQPFQHNPLRLNINSILIGLAAVLFVDVTPIEYAILTLSGVRVRLDVLSFFVAAVILISIQRYTARLIDTANLYAAAFITLLILSSQWSPSQIAVDVYIMGALTTIPLAYGLGLCMDLREWPQHVFLQRSELIEKLCELVENTRRTGFEEARGVDPS